MIQHTYINRPVADLSASGAFFAACGFRFKDEYSDETAAGMVLSDNTFVMLLTETRFKDFTPHAISDPNSTTEVLVALQVSSSQEVDDPVSRAVESGGQLYNEPQEYDFMYGHGFKDLDGHIWEVFAMTGQ
jgi:predicted lactoylglutathione lyase